MALILEEKAELLGNIYLKSWKYHEAITWKNN